MENNPLLLYAVNKQTETSAWSALVFAVVKSHTTIDATFATLEKDYKEATGETTLPPKYRSAKSTLSKAWRAGVDIMQTDDDGSLTPLPKSVMYTNTKAALGLTTGRATTYEDKVVALVTKLTTLNHECAVEQSRDLKPYIKEVLYNAGYI